MFLLCTGKQPFQREDKIEMNSNFNLQFKLVDYSESKTFADMVDFMSSLLTNDSEKRSSAAESLNHVWLKPTNK